MTSITSNLLLPPFSTAFTLYLGFVSGFLAGFYQQPMEPLGAISKRNLQIREIWEIRESWDMKVIRLISLFNYWMNLKLRQLLYLLLNHRTWIVILSLCAVYVTVVTGEVWYVLPAAIGLGVMAGVFWQFWEWTDRGGDSLPSNAARRVLFNPGIALLVIILIGTAVFRSAIHRVANSTPKVQFETQSNSDSHRTCSNLELLEDNRPNDVKPTIARKKPSIIRLPFNGQGMDSTKESKLSDEKTTDIKSEVVELTIVRPNLDTPISLDDILKIGHKLAGPLSEVLPEALRGLDIAQEAARTFMNSFADSTGENLSDFLFNWLAREREALVKDEVAAPSTVVYFNHASSNVPPSGLGKVSTLPLRTDRLYLVIASADRSGPERANIALALQRGKEVFKVLLAHGVHQTQILILVRPELALPIITDDGVREPENRRVEVWVR